MNFSLRGFCTHRQTATFAHYICKHQNERCVEDIEYSIGWIGLSSVLRPRQHNIGYMADGFTGQKTQPTVSKVLKEHTIYTDTLSIQPRHFG